jgi:ABC-type uncharacterized transport system permease subunit
VKRGGVAVEVSPPGKGVAYRILRERPARLGQAAWPAVGLTASLVCLAPLIALAGASLVAGYKTLFSASLGSAFGFASMLTLSVPLIVVGLGVAVPFRARLFNIGGEGQLTVGALGAVVVGRYATFLDAVPGNFVVALLGGAVAGGLLGAIAGALRAWRGINEVITTIMLNFLGVLLVEYWITGRFRDKSLSYTASPSINSNFALGHFGGVAQFPFSVFVALALALIVFVATAYMRFGWRLQVLGASEDLARRQGISVAWTQVWALTIGGALAGAGGAAELLGNEHRVGIGFSPGWGFDAIAIALLARGNALAVVPFALFYGFLRNGAGVLEANLGIPSEVIGMLAGAPVLIVAALIGWRTYRTRAAGV